MKEQDGEKKRLTIKMERGPCYGPCPIYSLIIYGTGEVIYKGKDFVRVKGTKKTNLSPDKIKNLINSIKNTDFFSLKDSYENPTLSCQPTTVLSITLNEKTKTITHDPSDMSAPKELTSLEDYIDKIVNIAQWIE